MLLLESTDIEFLSGLLNLLIELFVELLILEGSLIKFLLKSFLLYSFISHVVKHCKLLVIDATLIISQ